MSRVGGGQRGPWGALASEDSLSRDEAERVLRRLWRMLRPWRARVLGSVAIVLGQTACLLAGPALVRHGIDAGLLAHDGGALDLSAVLYLVTAFVALAFGRWSIRAVARIGETFLQELRIR